MGVLVAESGQTQNQTAVVDKKKNRRSRRSKKNSPPTASSSLTGCLGESNFKGGVTILDHEGSKEISLPGGSNITFTSLPTMRLNEQAEETESLPMQLTFSPRVGGQVHSGSCSDPIVYGDPPITSYPQRKYFSSHWPAEAVHKALERGHVFKALFRVNAHNRLEAYCKVDGVRTDVLISGAAAQNRAVEGDIVAVEIDPLSLWTRMKGYTVGVENSSLVDDGMLESDKSDFVTENCKGKNKVDTYYEFSSCGNCSSPLENALGYRSGQPFGEISDPEEKVPVEYDYVNRYNMSDLKPSEVGCYSEIKDAMCATERLSASVNSFPSKRPTGRIVAILKGSPRRDTIVGFLGVKKWMWSIEGNKKDLKKNKYLSTALNHQYLLFTPNDPRFSKMMVPFKSLPDLILKRLEAGDVTVEMDLVAARIADWAEENYIPEANVTNIFGRGGEVEPRLSAILYENAIDSSEFCQETVSCLPSIPWEIPKDEHQSRRDFRNLCVFTIDPATATDLDDALSVERLPNGNFRVGVHIADVSYFVLPDSALDENAHARSTSVYLLLSKLPMLPPLLSENLGSLNPGVDRLAFSIFWDINQSGEIIQRWIGRTIIQSCCKLSYEHAQDIIDGLDDLSSYKGEHSWPVLNGFFKWSDVITSVKNLYEICKILKKKRFEDGALSLESPKIVFLFDEKGIPYDSVLSGRKASNMLVEELMILANRTAAEVITRAYPSSALLRRHPEPNPRKLREFESFCSKHGLRLDITSSGKIHNSLECIRRELGDDSMLIDILMSYATKPMQLAAYFCSGDVEDEKDRCHYALAVPLYTHITSPLRRYPDILVHRMLAAAVEAEEEYLKLKLLQNPDGEEMRRQRCLTDVYFDEDAVGSPEIQEALSAAASKNKIPGAEMLADIASHCNERKLACRHVKDAIEKLYMWVLLKRKEILFSEARVMDLGPRFMSLYIQKLATEHRIYYDEVEGLTVEWLETTSTLVLSPSTNKRFNRRGIPGKCRSLEEVALILNPCELSQELDFCGPNNREGSDVKKIGNASRSCLSGIPNIEPAVFPVTLRLLSTITVALHSIGGGYGPLDIGARLLISSYFK